MTAPGIEGREGRLDSAPPMTFRHPVEADHRRIHLVIDDWFGRRIRGLLPRLWFRHFTGTSWMAETGTGALAGFLVGFVSPDEPDEAVIVLVGVDPNTRRRGVGRGLVERFVAGAAADGVRRVTAVAWPDEPPAIRFLEAMGFGPDMERATQRLFGVPSVPDYEGDREDRALFIRDL